MITLARAAGRVIQAEGFVSAAGAAPTRDRTATHDERGAKGE